MDAQFVAVRFADQKAFAMHRVHEQALPPGTPVDVFSRFSDAWTPGFEIASNLQGGYQLRRVSDQSVVPGTFRGDDLRRRHRAR